MVPFSYATPMLLGTEGRRDEYGSVGDVHIDKFMRREAMHLWKEGRGKAPQVCLPLNASSATP